MSFWRSIRAGWWALGDAIAERRGKRRMARRFQRMADLQPKASRPDPCEWCAEEPAHYVIEGREVNEPTPGLLLRPVPLCYGCGRDSGHGWVPKLLPGHTDDPRAACIACSPSSHP